MWIVGLLKSLWTAVGPLAGVLIGAWLARSWDKEKWIRDVRKEECQELLISMSDAAAKIMPRSSSNQEKNDAHLQFVRVFSSRMFIAKEINDLDLLAKWSHAVHDVRHGGEHGKFDDVFDEIKERIIAIAMK